MSKHTPGPWSEIPQHAAGPMIAKVIETGKQMEPTRLRLIAHMLQRGDSLIEDQANAKLIAAAPALLEALEASAPVVCSMNCESVKTTDHPWHHSPFCMQVQAVIAAAKGEA